MTDRPPSTPRRLYEAQQAAFLAPYAVTAEAGARRRRDEPEHPYRTGFQRDRDRIVHCSAFRRLDFKTQVFVPHEHDHFRTRMTHTIEVAQVGRALARALRLNEDLAEAVALAHDLGHCPFGHGGEAALAECMADHGGFEHNRQSLRVVDYLEHPYPRFRGLNLTLTVRECIARHETRYDQPATAEFADGLQAPLEGQLVDLADEIAFTAADLEDALAAEWLGDQQLQPLALWQEAWEAAERETPQARPIHKRIRACKGVLAIMADDAVAATAANVSAAGVESVDAVRQSGGKLAEFSEARRTAVRQLQDFLHANVYLHPRSAEVSQAGRRMIRELFDSYAAAPLLLPERYRKRIETDGLHRVICDYVAGMTDRFCKQAHRRICGR